MGTAWVECWKCDECGHRWIKSEIWPDRCASSKCRKRSWNKVGHSPIPPKSDKPVMFYTHELPSSSAPETAAGASLLAPGRAATPEERPSVIAQLQGARVMPLDPKAIPLIDQLRASIAEIEAKPAASLEFYGPGIVEMLVPCKHKEWAEDGEQYACALGHGHKCKCVRGVRLS